MSELPLAPMTTSIYTETELHRKCTCTCIVSEERLSNADCAQDCMIVDHVASGQRTD